MYEFDPIRQTLVYAKGTSEEQVNLQPEPITKPKPKKESKVKKAVKKLTRKVKKQK